MTTLISKTELAKRGGVTRQAITVLAREKIKDACHGNKVDVDHPSVIAWLESKQVQTIKLSDADRHLMEHWKADRPNGAAELHRIRDMTVMEVVRKFGTEDAYMGWLKSVKMVEDIDAAMLKNDQARGSVMDVELVRNHVMSLVDGTWRRLLGDTSKTISARAIALVKSGATAEELELAIRDVISSQLKALRSKSQKMLKAVKDA